MNPNQKKLWLFIFVFLTSLGFIGITTQTLGAEAGTAITMISASVTGTVPAELTQSLAATNEATTGASAPELIAQVVGGGAKTVRSAPTVNSGVVTTVPPGTTVGVSLKANLDLTHPNLPWYYVRLPDGTKGWMRSDLLNIIGPTPFGTTATPTPNATAGHFVARPAAAWAAGTRLKINSANVWLRTSPSSQAGQVATLAFQNPVTATGSKHFDGRQWWWQVRADWGAVGWVEQALLLPA